MSQVRLTKLRVETGFGRWHRHKSDPATRGLMCKGWEARGSVADLRNGQKQAERAGAERRGGSR